ncbi:MAG: DJ-1/PfpI family protein [Verrucomicrobiota bacterium]
MQEAITVGMVVFPEFELLDVFGPLEFLGNYPADFQLIILGESTGAVPSIQGPSIVAESALSETPEVGILMVPGGIGSRKFVNNSEALKEIHRLATVARYVCSICTGAGILARAGLLNNKRATTNKLAYTWATSQGPSTKWIPHARWVQDGNTWTSAGVSAGMDMTLALIAEIHGSERAQEAAIYAEYTWNNDPNMDPFAGPAGLLD